MLKVVLLLFFAVFALTTGLPLRNTFYEDVDDYNREFIPKEKADFDESAYDEYLYRREPIKINPGLCQFRLISHPELIFYIYMRMFTWCLQIRWRSILARENDSTTNIITEIYRVGV